MSKHRRSKKYSGSYDEINEYNDYYNNQYNGNENDNIINKLSSILGNIDVNQITSLLNAIGIINNADNLEEKNDLNNSKKESSDSYDSDINLFELVSKAKAVNDMIMNENAGIYTNQDKEIDNDNNEYLESEEPQEESRRSKHSKKKSHKNHVKEKIYEDRVHNTTQNMEKNIYEDSKQYSEEYAQDSIVALLNAIKPLVPEDKAQIIDKILDLYIEGKI